MEAFKAENPGVEIPEDKPAEAAAPVETPAVDAETKPAEDETKPPEAETKPGDDEPFSLQDEPAITPQALNELFKGDETLKAAIEANPAAKGAIMKLAREHAELAQFKGIFPDKASAEFSRDTANRTVSLRSQFQMAEGPEGMAKAFDSFMQEFAVIGADGKQVMDDSGAPVYGDDLYAFGEHVVTRYADSTLEEVDARLAANQYPSEAAKQRDEDLKIALDIIKGDLHPSDTPTPDPDLSSLTPDVRAQVQSRLDEAKRIEAENKAKTAGAGKQSRAELQKKGNNEFFQAAADRLWPQVKTVVEKLRAAGAVIPDWQLTAPVPGLRGSGFENAVGNQITEYIKSDPYATSHNLQLEMQYLANPTPENMAARVKYFDRILQSRDETGRSLINRIVSGIVHKHGAQVSAAANTTAATVAAAAKNASQEPRQGGPVKPHTMTQKEAWDAAEGQLAKEVNGWQNMDAGERMSYTLGRQRQLMNARH